MKFELEIDINKYIESCNNKLKELDYFYNNRFNLLIEERYNSYFNKFFIKKNKNTLNKELKDELNNYKKKYYYNDNNYEISLIFKYKFIYPEEYTRKLEELEFAKKNNNKNIKIDSTIINFIKLYQTNSDHMNFINKQIIENDFYLSHPLGS